MAGLLERSMSDRGCKQLLMTQLRFPFCPVIFVYRFCLIINGEKIDHSLVGTETQESKTYPKWGL